MKAYLGIDLGTSAVKAALLGEDGEFLGMGESALVFATPRPGYAEQNPEHWWHGAVAATGMALAVCAGKAEVAGIGISGQMLGSVLIDKDGRADRRGIIWMDQRAAKQRDDIEARLGLDAILDRTANYPLVSLWAPKLLWLRENEPDRYDRIEKVLFPKDYLKYRLTGTYDIDATDAPGTLLFNTAGRVWDDGLFRSLDIPRGFVPAGVSESVDIIGRVRREAAGELGVPEGTPVVAGGGDQMCGGVGLGVVRPGVVSSTIGTSGVVFTLSETCVVDRQPRALLSYCHSVPGTWCLYGCTLSAGGSFQWLRNTFFKNARMAWDTCGASAYAFMDALASESAPGCEGLVFLPYLSGERTPHPDPHARGVFFGLSQRHDAGEICRAVMEGVVYSLRDTIDILREHGLPAREVRAAGGGAASPLWLQMQADIFNAQVAITNIKESPAAGAAILAAVGTGRYASVRQAADDVVRVVRTCDPLPENVKIYDEYYVTYRALYPALRPLYASQAGKVDLLARP
jgi:xylulokinase